VGLVVIDSALVLAADNPAALAQFYAALLGVERQPGFSARHWLVPWPTGGWLECYGPSRDRPQPRQQGRLAVCLKRQAAGQEPLATLEAWMGAAQQLGASSLLPPRLESFGAEAWVLDPEGNRLLLMVCEAGGRS
jgi:hypothetical protein